MKYLNIAAIVMVKAAILLKNNDMMIAIARQSK